MIREIHNDRALRYLGALLALANGLVALHWTFVHPLAEILAPQNWPAICWPFWPDCTEIHTFSPVTVHALLVALGVLSIVVAGFFLAARTTLAWWSLAFLAIVKLSIVSLDYRLRLNQHAMTAWLVFAFLLVPNKRRVIAWLLVAIYFWAGVLKLTPEWLNGAALYGRLPLPDWALVPACVYVVILELVLIFGLLARNARIFWMTMAQLIIFHAISLPVVNFYYPVLMLLLLAFLPLCRAIPPPATPLPRWPSVATLVVFGAVQFAPLAFPGDVLLTGEGRLWALHMFDAPLECQAWLTPHAPDGRAGSPTPLRVGFLANRILCDPIVYASAARGICAHNAGRVGMLDLHLQTRRAGEAEFHTIVDAHNVCAQPLPYSLTRHNTWIQNGDQRVPAQAGVPEFRGQ